MFFDNNPKLIYVQIMIAFFYEENFNLNAYRYQTLVMCTSPWDMSDDYKID